MIDTTAVLYNFLSAVSAVTDQLDTYSSEPAIFEGRAPDSFEINDPILVIDAPINAGREDTSTHVNRTVDIRLRVYARTQTETGATGYAALNAAAETVANALHNSRPPLTGGTTLRVSAQPPTFAPTENPSLGGRVISIRWIIKET